MAVNSNNAIKENKLLARESGSFRGLIVHAYADMRRDRLYVIGRLEDGRSFVVMESRWRPSAHIYARDQDRCTALLAALHYERQPAGLEDFSGKEKLLLLCFSRYGDSVTAARLLENAGIKSPDADMKPADAFLTQRYIRGPVEIRGSCRPGRLPERRVDLVFPDPEMVPLDTWDNPDHGSGHVCGQGLLKVPLRIASIDIETDTHDGSIRAVGIASADAMAYTAPEYSGGLVRVVAVDAQGPETGAAGSMLRVMVHPDERSLLKAFIADIQALDPDVLTGWNFLDFDCKCLAARCSYYGIPFALGRSTDAARYFSGEGRRSAAAIVPGRQVIDALRILRSGPKQGNFSDYTLETVAQAVLGEGKLVTETGTNKIAVLNRLYRENIRTFGEYCYRDAELVLRILAKTGLFRLTLERACLTGVSLDKAWTSVVSFERIYGMELRRKGISPLPAASTVPVSGAAGGTLLDPLPGIFNNIAVFDFRSLYPTIMRTFNIDPLAYERAIQFPKDTLPHASYIVAPNGAVFSRNPGLLPVLIAEYFASRTRALDAGDETAAHVYKILMNSFYGVLGTKACRYGRTELAGAITSFARKWLHLSRDWFTAAGYRVIYGDTDSLFVETTLTDAAGYGDFLEQCDGLAAQLNRFLTERIQAEYALESFIELRFEKGYRRFMIPPLRGFHDAGESRGRAKGYGGYLLHPEGGVSVEVKGMEAVRSDATPLARRIQLELLELVFSGGGETALGEKVFETLEQLRSGKLDGELIYRKRLSRPPETYTSSTPPQVKAARALGWKQRRGTVEFVWTLNGPEPVSLPHAALDYDHYIDSQVLPVARSIAGAANWDMALFPAKGRDRESWHTEDRQLELDL
ncbi:MAG: DNA polymerase II [Treponema sp.]|jgi:DNA polymerase-2|nr:DNA polymerase II [Treponema sp.]